MIIIDGRMVEYIRSEDLLLLQMSLILQVSCRVGLPKQLDLYEGRVVLSVEIGQSIGYPQMTMQICQVGLLISEKITRPPPLSHATPYVLIWCSA